MHEDYMSRKGDATVGMFGIALTVKPLALVTYQDMLQSTQTTKALALTAPSKSTWQIFTESTGSI
jgi:hypothetical protein